MTVTYADYAALRPGGLTEEEFAAALPRALLLLDAVTAGRTETAGGRALARAKAAACLLCDAVAASDAAADPSEPPLLSASSEGYAETYRPPEPVPAGDLPALAARLLSGTGLAGAL